MGTYTPYWNFLKADPSDFVDVVSQVDRNLDIIDLNGPKFFNYNYFSVPIFDNIPVGGYKTGAKMYSVAKNGVFVMQNGGTGSASWEDTVVSTAVGWTVINLVAGLNQVGAPDFPPEYRIDDGNGRCYLRGKIIRAGNAANALGTDINVTNAGAVPNPSATIRIPEMICCGGIVSSTPPYSTWYQVRVSATGQLIMRRQGLLTQPVSAQNYIALDGFSYAL